jgi:uncharacterized protein (TIGR03066 family)
MRALLFTAIVSAFVAGSSRADDDKAVEDLKKALVGKWVPDKKDVGPVEFTADGKIKQPFVQKEGAWVFAEGTYTIDAKGEVKLEAKSGGVTLGGWYKLKDGVLTTARGPYPLVTFKKEEEKKDK